MDSGQYVLDILDLNLCPLSGNVFDISQPTPLSIDTSINSPTCGLTDGSISVSVTGGTIATDYGYDWDDLSTPNSKITFTQKLDPVYKAIEKVRKKLTQDYVYFEVMGSVICAASALEMACWDIVGKALDRPIYDLLGGKVHERLRTYTYLYPNANQEPASFYNDPFASAAAAANYIKNGFTAVKFDPAGPYTVFDGRQPDLLSIQRSENFCREIRQAVDNSCLLYTSPSPRDQRGSGKEG